MDLLATFLLKNRLVDLMYHNADFCDVEVWGNMQPFVSALETTFGDLLKADQGDFFSTFETGANNLAYRRDTLNGGWQFFFYQVLSQDMYWCANLDLASPLTTYGNVVIHHSSQKAYASDLLAPPITVQSFFDGYAVSSYYLLFLPGFMK